MTQRLTRRRVGAATAVAALALAGVAGANPATATGNDGVKVAHLDPLNNSGTTGHAHVRVLHHAHLDAKVQVHGAAPGLVHAQHIHFGEQARHECPTNREDTNRDHRINTVEGVPAYGPVAVSLTTTGNTDPASVLAVDRYPVADKNGNYHYKRDGLAIHQTADQDKHEVAKAIAAGQGVVVVHGVDYNNNGKYDFEGAGKSELDPNLPAEATDPAACGVLR